MSEATKLIQRARASLIMSPGWKGAFFGSLAMRLNLVETSSVPTMATDGTSLFYNPQWPINEGFEKTLGTVVHEVWHCALLHHTRIGNRDIRQFNIAADYSTNENVQKSGFALFNGALRDAKFDGMAVEEIFNALFPPIPPQESKPQAGEDEGEEPETGNNDQETNAQSEPGEEPGEDEGSNDPGKSPQPGKDGASDDPAGDEAGDAGEPGSGEDGAPSDGGSAEGGSGDEGQPGSGSGSSSQPVPDYGDADGGILPAPVSNEAERKAEAQKWEQAVRQAASLSKARNAGEMPSVLRELIEELNSSRIDWRAILQEWFDNATVQERTWKRPNRRYPGAKFIMPGSINEGIERLVFCVDTSGSMNEPALNAAKAELQQAFAEGKIGKLTVISADEAVCAIDEFEPGEEIEFVPMRKTGGTNFIPTFEWIAENADDATAIVYFTDMVCNDFGTDPGCPVLWLKYENANWPIKPTFGETLQMIV